MYFLLAFIVYMIYKGVNSVRATLGKNTMDIHEENDRERALERHTPAWKAGPCSGVPLAGSVWHGFQGTFITQQKQQLLFGYHYQTASRLVLLIHLFIQFVFMGTKILYPNIVKWIYLVRSKKVGRSPSLLAKSISHRLSPWPC